ncbi:MAG: hypothetical protein D6744_11415 [Planctomycetota bacterium]|nr:MAG: hypothetical protein D6744_11415 [Planctomycetota bacterium]
MRRRPRILLAAPLDDDTERRLSQEAEVRRPRDDSLAAICEALRDCDALIARTHTPVTREVLEAAPRLRVVGVAGVGLDRVDVAAARQRGVEIIHTPEASSDAVAEYAVLLMFLLLRPIPRLAQAYRDGRFREARTQPHGRELRSLTVGIVGMGRIGRRVGRICAAGIGASVIYNDIADVEPLEFPARRVDKPELYAAADIVTLHVPLTDATRRLIDARVLATFRPGALLINTARGAVVDTDALVSALRCGRLGGAALDVTEPEPLPPDHPLFACENCIVLPHVAARTHEGLARMYAVADAVIERLREASSASDESE